MFDWFKRKRRRKILAAQWPDEWSLHLNRNVRLSWGMTPREVDELQNRIKVFVAEKHWEGHDRLTVTDEMRVTIAALACMMLLGVEGFYFDNVKSILVFPDSVFARIKRWDDHEPFSTVRRSVAGRAGSAFLEGLASGWAKSGRRAQPCRPRIRPCARWSGWRNGRADQF